MPINGETHDGVVRLEAEMKFCRQRCDERHIHGTLPELRDHDKRILGLERLGWKVMGGAVVGGAVGGVVTQIIGWLLHVRGF